MNGYLCFYQGNKFEVNADTSYSAQQKAADMLRRKYPRRRIKDYEITVVLAEKEGQQVVHAPLM